MIDIRIKTKKNQTNKEEKILNFVSQQFQKLLKKNLKIPVTLYHL